MVPETSSGDWSKRRLGMRRSCIGTTFWSRCESTKTGWWFQPIWLFPICGKIKTMLQTTNQKIFGLQFGQLSWHQKVNPWSPGHIRRPLQDHLAKFKRDPIYPRICGGDVQSCRKTFKTQELWLIQAMKNKEFPGCQPRIRWALGFQILWV